MRLQTLVVAALCVVATTAQAAGLRGSKVSMDRQNARAKAEDFTFLPSAGDIQEFVRKRRLVKVPGNADYFLRDVAYPYARPAVKLFVERLSAQFRDGCGERLAVTSLTRPMDEQPSNASKRSVHPTGMAVDFGVPKTTACRKWLASNLRVLEDRKVLEATREHVPAPHYHVAVFPTRYARYVCKKTGGKRCK